MEPRTAFTRAAGFLNFSAGWKWTAWVAGVFAALATLGLFVILALFVDLLVHRGHVPPFVELRQPAKVEYDRQWRTIDVAKRKELVDALLPTDTAKKALDADYIAQNDFGRDWLWRAQVFDILQSRVSSIVAESYKLDVQKNDNPPVVSLGLVSFGLRNPGLVQRATTWVASWNSWTWRRWESTEPKPNIPYLTGLAIIAFALAIVRAGSLNLMNYAAATATLDAATRLRRAVYHQSYRLGTLTLKANPADETVEIFARDVEQIHDGLYAMLTTLFFLPITLGLLIIFALALHFWLALACLMFGAIVVLLGGYMAARYRDRARSEGRKAAGQLGLLRESLALMRLCKSNCMELFNQSRVERQLADYSAASFERFRNESFFGPLLLFMATVSATLALYVAGWAVLFESASPIRLIVLAAVLAAIFRPVTVFLHERTKLRKARAAAVPVFEFLDRPGEVGQVVGAEFMAGLGKGIEYRSVSLREPGAGRLLLNDVNLKIKAGQRVAIVGTDDTEKHALVYLLLRFLDATTGEVRIDDKSVKWLTLESVRAQIGLVLWDSLVFNDTVVNNIGCGEASISVPQIIDCAKLAHVHQFVQKLPYGYETPIGEFGTKLRRSERFRIALARAILKDPALYIIEEPAKAFDDGNKALIDDTLARVLPGKTVIYLAHRISTIKSCDVVYLIHRGQVEAAGEHRELIARSELYKHLHYMEFNEFANV